MGGNYLYPEMDLKERMQVLGNMCMRTEELTYTRTLTEEELAKEKDTFSRESMAEERLIKQLTDIKKEFMGKIKALRETKKARLEVIENQKFKVSDQVYLIADRHAGKVLYVDKNGEIVNTRDVVKNEMQGSLFVGDGVQVQTAGADSHITDVEIEVVQDDHGSMDATKEADFGAMASSPAERAKFLCDLGFGVDQQGYIYNGAIHIDNDTVNNSSPEEWASVVAQIRQEIGEVPAAEIVNIEEDPASEALPNVDEATEDGRRQELGALGLVWSGKTGHFQYVTPDAIYQVSPTEIKSNTQEEWANEIASIKQFIADAAEVAKAKGEPKRTGRGRPKKN